MPGLAQALGAGLGPLTGSRASTAITLPLLSSILRGEAQQWVLQATGEEQAAAAGVTREEAA